MAGCPENVEIERPMNYFEVVSGSQTWDEYGIRIARSEPEIPGDCCVNAGTPMTLRLYVDARKDPQLAPECIFAQCWTNIKTECNPCGIWKERFLPLNLDRSTHPESDEEVRTFVYEASLVPDSCGKFQVTFFVKWNHLLIWLNTFQRDSYVDVFN